MPDKTDLYADRLAVYEAMVAGHPDIERKGKTMPYTSMNGNMFSFLATDGTICLRLPKDAVAAFEAEHGTGPVRQYGAIMKEYVALPDRLVGAASERAALFRTSVAYARTLKPKATKRKA